MIIFVKSLLLKIYNINLTIIKYFMFEILCCIEGIIFHYPAFVFLTLHSLPHAAF